MPFIPPLREFRQQARKSQQQVAAALCITRSAYSKLERGQTELTVKRACYVAQIFKILPSALLPMPTPDPTEIGTAAAELQYLRTTAEHSVLDAYIRAIDQYEEQVPFDELDEYCWDYLAMCNIRTREEYEAAGMLIGRPAAGTEQLAFEQSLRAPDIYSLFQHGIITDEFLLKFWQIFQAKATPYFEFEDKPFGSVVKRLFPSEEVAAVDGAMLSSWPEPLPVESDESAALPRPMYQPGSSIEDFAEEFRLHHAATHAKSDTELTPAEIKAHIETLPPVNWTEITQQSEARDLAWELEQLVFTEADPVFAHLRDDPAEYARTLTRLAGLAWVMESLTEEMSSIDVLAEEAARLTGEGYSTEFQNACDLFLAQQREAYR